MIDPTYGIDVKYYIPDELWQKTEMVIPPPKPKKVSGRPRMDDRRAMTVFSMYYVPDVSGKQYPKVLEQEARFMTSFKVGYKKGYLKKYGKLVYWNTTKKKTGLEMAVYGWSDDKGPIRRRKDRKKPH